MRSPVQGSSRGTRRDVGEVGATEAIGADWLTWRESWFWNLLRIDHFLFFSNSLGFGEFELSTPLLLRGVQAVTQDVRTLGQESERVLLDAWIPSLLGHCAER